VFYSLVLYAGEASNYQDRMKHKSALVFLIIIVAGISYYSLYPKNYPNGDSFRRFMLELNCTLPHIPDKTEILHVETRSINEEGLRDIAINVFGFKNITSMKNEGNRLSISSEGKTLRYYVTDYITFEDRFYENKGVEMKEQSYENRIIEVNETWLRERGDGFIRMLDEHWEEPTDTELLLERMEFPEINLHSQGGVRRSEQPQYIVYYHHLNGTHILALNAEFNLGFFDDRIVYAQISRINVVKTTIVENVKTPMDAIIEAFPDVKMGGGVGVASIALVPVRGRIIIEDIRLFYYNWHDAVLGESYDLVPHYKIKALFVGPDIHGNTQGVLLNRVISAIE
jgi:hypothetical protein